MDSFNAYNSLHAKALFSCNQMTIDIQQMIEKMNQSKFKPHYKLLIYEMLENLKENCEVAKRHIDEAYQAVEDKVKSIPNESTK